MLEKILIIQTAFLGDAILTLPLIQKIKNKYDSAEIDVVAIPASEEIFSISPHIKNVFVLDKRGKEKSIFSTIKFALDLKKNNYTKIYSPHRSFRTSLIIGLIGAKESYGFSNSSFKFIYKKRVKYNPDIHEVERNLSLLGNFKSSWKIFPEVNISKNTQEKIRKILSDHNIEKYVVVAPGSVWETKKYPIEYHKKVINKLINSGYTVILIGGKGDREVSELISLNVKEIINLCGELTIVESIELIKNCELLVSNDSAPTHMGMCVDAKVLTLYNSTVPRFGFYPYNDRSGFISFDEPECKPCGIHGFKECPQQHFDCGMKLTPEMVIDKIFEMILN